MSSSNVIVIIGGKDDTGALADSVIANLKRTENQARETESRLAQMGEVGKKALEGIGVTFAFGEVVSKLHEAVVAAGEFGEQIDKAGKRTGLSVATLSTLHYAAAVTGSDFDGLSGATGKLGANLASAAAGNTKLNAVFQSLGLNAKDLAGREDGVEVALKAVAHAMNDGTTPANRLLLAKTLLGKAGQELIPVLMEVGENFDSFREKATAAGVQLDAVKAKQLAEFNQKLKDLQERAAGAGLAMTQGLSPALQTLASELTGSNDKLAAWEKLGNGIGASMLFVAGGVAQVAGAVATIGETAMIAVAGVLQLGAVLDSISSLGANEKSDKRVFNDLAEMERTLGGKISGNAKWGTTFSDAGHDMLFGKDAQTPLKKMLDASGDDLIGQASPEKKGKGWQGVDTEGAGRADAHAQRVRDAEAKVAEARAKAGEQAAQSQAETAKNAADLALAMLEDRHKRELVSDADFFRERAAIQADALQKEEAAVNAKKAALGSEVTSTVIKFGRDRGHAVEQLNDGAKIIELQTKVNELEDKRLALVEKRKKLETEAGTEAFEAARKAGDEELRIAAEVEALRGGGTAAREAQTATQRGRQRDALVVSHASPQELENFDYQSSVGVEQSRTQGAEDTERNAESGISAQRSAVRYAEASGAVSSLEARRELIALDRQEADALQPVLAAYQQLAALGVDGAAGKVAELQEKIGELKNPVDQVAMEIRGQFDTAFESLFENLDKGKKAWQGFAQSLEKDLMKDAYKQFVQPALQGAMMPKAGGAAGATPASAAGGWMSKILPGIMGGAKPTAAGGTTVQIINQSATPVQATQASVESTQDLVSTLRAPVIQIVLEDMERGGTFGQALSGLGGLMA